MFYPFVIQYKGVRF